MFTFEGEVWNQTITLLIPSFDDGMMGKNACWEIIKDKMAAGFGRYTQLCFRLSSSSIAFSHHHACANQMNRRHTHTKTHMRSPKDTRSPVSEKCRLGTRTAE